MLLEISRAASAWSLFSMILSHTVSQVRAFSPHNNCSIFAEHLMSLGEKYQNTPAWAELSCESNQKVILMMFCCTDWLLFWKYIEAINLECWSLHLNYNHCWMTTNNTKQWRSIPWSYIWSFPTHSQARPTKTCWNLLNLTTWKQPLTFMGETRIWEVFQSHDRKRKRVKICS